MHACEAAAGAKWSKMAHCPKPTTTGTSFGNFIYTSIVCNDTTLSQTIPISSLEANLSLEDKKQFCRQKPTSQVYLPQN